MTAHHLWTEWHLVPCGWVRGSEKSELGSIFEVEVPDDRVMTCRVEQDEEPEGTVVRQEVSTVWRSADDGAVERLVRAFGSCPSNL